MRKRLRAQITYTLEYDADPENYGLDPDDPDLVRKMAKIDSEGDLTWVMESPDADFHLVIEDAFPQGRPRGPIQIEEWRESNNGSYSDRMMRGGPSHEFRVRGHFRVPSVHMRSGPFWRPDNRYPGHWSVLRDEHGNLVIQRDASRHGAKPPAPWIIPAKHVDSFIYSCLTCRPRDAELVEEVR